MTSGQKMIQKALNVSVQAHDGQLDKGGMPYVFHPIAVMMKCQTDKERVVALLHDVVEDTYMTFGNLRQDFPEYIVEAVDAITKRRGETQNEYLTRVKQNDIALAVKFNDIEHNSTGERLMQLPVEDIERLTKKYKKAVEFLRS